MKMQKYILCALLTVGMVSPGMGLELVVSPGTGAEGDNSTPRWRTNSTTVVGEDNSEPWSVMDDITLGDCFDNTMPAKNDSFCLDVESVGGCANQITFLMYLPREKTTGGARFCPTLVTSYRANSGKNPKLLFNGAKSASETDCFWACHNGWGGSKCEDRVMEISTTATKYAIDYIAGYCQSEQITRFTGSDSESNATSGGASVEKWGEKAYECNDSFAGKRSSNAKQYHYLSVSVKGMVPSGYGVIAQPIQLRAFSDRGNDVNRVMAKPIGSEMIMCSPGYMVSSSGLDCVPINTTACGNVTFCEKWKDIEMFQDSQMYKKYTVVSGEDEYHHEQTCLQYRCAQSGYAFAGDPLGADDSGRKCIECSEGVYVTVNSANGQCIRTEPENGEGIDTNPKTGEIVVFDLRQTRKSDMVSKKDADGKACWLQLLTGDDEYKKCLKGGTTVSERKKYNVQE